MAYGGYNTRNFTSGINRNFTGMRPQGGSTGSQGFISGRNRLTPQEHEQQGRKQAHYYMDKIIKEGKAPGAWGRSNKPDKPWVAKRPNWKWGPEGTYYTSLLNQHYFPDWGKETVKDAIKNRPHNFDARGVANRAKYGKYGLGIGVTPDMREKTEVKSSSPFSRIQTHKGV